MRTRSRLENQLRTCLQRHQVSDEQLIDDLLNILMPERVLTDQQQMIGALCQVMHWASELNGGRVAPLASKLLQMGVRPETILSEYGPSGGYWEHDWRGRQGEVPNERAISETILFAINGWTNDKRGERMPDGV